MLGTLAADVRDKVVLQLGEDVTLTGVIRAATLVKSAPAAGVAVEIGKERSGAAMAAARPAPQSREVRSPSPYSQSARTGPRCFGCGKTGHLRRDCPVKCFECGRAGHLRRNCPQVTLNGSGGPQAGPAAPGQ
ncbi:MAG: hypothetical protein K0U66_01145 [Gammaproteobacteria bacterium]|nr:hypothetical protein [Gammaproteobacteria bacterium]